MKTVFVLNGVLVALQVALAVVLAVLYTTESAQPENTDSFIVLALLGAIVLLCLAVVLSGVMALLLTRSPLARIVYTVVVGLGAALSFTLQTLYVAIPDALLVIALVLIWLPDSKSFFFDTPGVTYYRNTGPGGTLR